MPGHAHPECDLRSRYSWLSLWSIGSAGSILSIGGSGAILNR